MRVTVAHHRTKQEVVQSVDHSFDQLFQGPGLRQVQVSDVQKSWQGDTLTFSLTAKMGFFNAPIKGTVEVTDQDIIIDADLGVLEHLIPAEQARELISGRIRALLP